MRQAIPKFAGFAIGLALVSIAAGAQSSFSGNAGNANGGASTNSGGQNGSNESASRSPYPGWAPQAGPIAPIPFVNTSAGVDFDPRFAMLSVVSAPATGAMLDLSLDDAIRLGLKYNLAMQLRQQQEKIASGQRSQALQPLLPVLTASASTALTETDLATEGFRAGAFANLPPGVNIPTIISYQTSSAQMNLQWTAFNYAQLKRYHAAKLQQQASASNTSDSRQTVVLNIGRAYLQVLAAFSALQNAGMLLKADEALLNSTIAEHQAGIVANVDELRARVQFQSQQQIVIANQNALQKRNIALCRMIGLDPAQQINLTETIPYAELDAQPPLAAVRDQAWHDRADYVAAQQQLQVAELRRDAARAERLPTLSFGGYYGAIGITYGSYHGNFIAQAQLKFPIFEEAQLRGDRAVAEEQITLDRTQADNLKQQIDADLRNAYLDYNSAKSLVAASRSNVELAQLEVQQSNERFRAGVTENLPVVDAQATLADAQNRLVNSAYQYNLAKLELARALGIIDRQYRDYLNGK